MNPFSDNYVRQEIGFYGLQPPLQEGRVSLIYATQTGLTPGLFHTEIRNPSTTLRVPAMFLNHATLVFSLTPLHLQGCYLPIQYATGRVLCLGLGMGYFALRAAQKSDVTEVVVVEINPAIIAFFGKHLGHRPETIKIKVVQGDAYAVGTRTTIGVGFDFCLCSIYPILYSNESVRDAPIFSEVYQTSRYHFFGMERLILEAGYHKFLRRSETSHTFRSMVEQWKSLNIRFQPILNETILRDFLRTALTHNLL